MTQNYEMVHTCIRVLDLEKSIKFYQHVLGLEVVKEKDFPEGKFTLVFMKSKSGDYELELTYNYDRKEPYTIGDGFSHIGLYVDDIEKSYQRHQEMGYKLGQLKQLSENSSKIYFIADPDGYEIEIIER